MVVDTARARRYTALVQRPQTIRSVAQGQARQIKAFPVECWIWVKDKPLSRAQSFTVDAVTHVEAENAVRSRLKHQHIRSLTWIGGPKIRVILDPKKSPRAQLDTEAPPKPAFKLRVIKREPTAKRLHLLERWQTRHLARETERAEIQSIAAHEAEHAKKIREARRAEFDAERQERRDAEAQYQAAKAARKAEALLRIEERQRAREDRARARAEADARVVEEIQRSKGAR